jgi:hypothetical protein
MTIPFDPKEPWSGSVISREPDTDVEMMTHIALTSLRGPPRRYCITTYRASPDLESGEPHMVAAP